MSLIGCTIAHSVVAAQATVLAKSFLDFHPKAQFAIIMLDRAQPPIAIPNTLLLGLADLDLGTGEEWRLPMILNRRELVSLLKPALLRTLLKGGAETVACFEYSTLVLAPLTETELREHAVAASAAIKNESDYGDFGRSFVAVRSGAEANLGSWFDRAWKESVAGSSPAPSQDRLATLEGIFDTVPHATIKSAGFALSYANLNPKKLEVSVNGYTIDGTPLRSFDFRGYDPDKPYLLSKYQGLQPRILLSEHSTVAALCDDYRQRILQNASAKPDGQSSVFEVLPSGLRIDERMRRLYREALEDFRRGERSEPPSPFGPGGEDEFLRWLNESVSTNQTVVTRYMLAARGDREDVQNAFPDPLGADAVAFRNWYQQFGQQEMDLPAAVVPPRHPTATKRPPAVNVAGYFRAELGLGVAARSILSALDAARIPFNTVSFGRTANRQDHPFVDRQAAASTADINLICVNPDQLPAFAEQTGPEFRHGRYTIGVWFWEVEDFPKNLHGAFNYVDEIWVASEFMRHAFLKVSPKPVFKFLLPIETPPIDRSFSRADLGLPGKFTFLFSLDLLSVLERKNPVGLIKAFKRAFPEGTGPALVIKTINGDKRCLEMEKLKYAARDRNDIIMMDRYLSPTENNTLAALADCYISLHRSEGFGLTIAEAMALGKPVIATAYSGNLEFMTEKNSYLCPSRRCEVGPEREPYPSHSHWSEPDLEAAAKLMRHVYEKQEEARACGMRAAEDIKLSRRADTAGQLIADRLSTIRSRRSSQEPVRTASFLQDRLDELEGLIGPNVTAAEMPTDDA